MIGYYFFKMTEFFLLLSGHRFRKQFFLFLAWIAYKLGRKQRLIIRQNLQFVYGHNLDPVFTEKIERHCFKNLMLNFMQMVENRHVSPEKLFEKVKIEPESIAELARERDRPIIFITGHFGRWELGGITLSEKIRPLLIVYKKMKNTYFQSYLDASRERFNLSLTEKNGAVKDLVKELKKGGAISLLIDTNLQKNTGEMVDFLGRATRTTTTAATLARKFNALIIPVVIISDQEEEHFTLRLLEPITVPFTDDEASDVRIATQKQATALETAIREHPEAWFWCHRRWKTDFPEIYT